MAGSVNRVELIGRVGSDPQSFTTAAGEKGCTFTFATETSWLDAAGAERDVCEGHRIVTWGKLGDICSSYLVVGHVLYLEGRLATRSVSFNGEWHWVTEVVATNMLILVPPRDYEDPTERARLLADHTRDDEPYSEPTEPDPLTQRVLAEGHA